MYAVVKDKRRLGAKITTVEAPRVKRDEVLVKVKAASICGTDVHIWNWSEWAQQRIQNIPLIFGHECAGEVVEVGGDVTSLQEGDMVSPEGHIVDGTCYQCRTDRMHICQNLEILGVDRDGVFAEYAALPERNAWKNDPRLDPFIASIQDPLGNAVHTAIPRENVGDIGGKCVAVLGCGPIGLMSIAIAKELGASRVFATAGGRNLVRMGLAEKMGAEIVLSAKEEGERIVEIIRDATDGRGVDVVFEMSGAPSAVRQAFEMLTPGGRISLLGLLNKPVEIDLNSAMILKGATVYGITGRRMFQTWYQVKELLAKPEFRKKIASVVTHKMPIKDITRGMELINSKRAAKVVLEPKWE